MLAAAGAFRQFIAGETLARRIEMGADLPHADVCETVDIDGREVVLSLRRCEGSGATSESRVRGGK